MTLYIAPSVNQDQHASHKHESDKIEEETLSNITRKQGDVSVLCAGELPLTFILP